MPAGNRIRTVVAVLAVLTAIAVAAVVWRGRGTSGPEPAVGLRHPPASTATRTAVPGYPPISPPRAAAVDCRRARCVALTFDDGPSRYTGRLLDILDARHVKATFFEISGHTLALPQIARRAYREGFAIGDHTVTHPNLTRIPPARVTYQIRTAAQQIAHVTGHAPTMMRAPFGAENATVRALVHMPLIQWNVSPQDWKIHNAAVIDHRVLARVRPGSIVVLHDTYPATIAAVPSIVDGLKARGYTLVTVPQLLARTGMRAGVVYRSG